MKSRNCKVNADAAASSEVWALVFRGPANCEPRPGRRLTLDLGCGIVFPHFRYSSRAGRLFEEQNNAEGPAARRAALVAAPSAPRSLASQRGGRGAAAPG